MFTKKYVCCPECKGTHFIYDSIHCETICMNCGLVIQAEYSYDDPGYLIKEKK